jgi:hypothetical protein
VQWIRTELVEDVNLTLGKMNLRSCDGAVHGNLMNQTWGCDADEFPWEQDRVGWRLGLVHIGSYQNHTSLLPIPDVDDFRT